MKHFLKNLIIFCIPFLLIAICYVITDPHKKIWDYDLYLCDYVMLHRGDISTRVYLNNKNQYKYNSFIFGSSRSCAHTSMEWKKYLSKKDIPYSFGSWEEPINAIYKKIFLIDSLKGSINNAIIIIDVDNTFKKSSQSNINFDHYLISGKSKIDYYLTDFFSYLRSPRLILSSIDFKLFHTKRFYMNHYIGMKKEELDPITNDWLPKLEKEILSDSIKYYEKCKNKFYKRPIYQRYADKQINMNEKTYLLKISSIFKKQKTKSKIIIAPLYDQIKINTQDLLLLQTIFGKNNVYDYSGINKITDNMYNYGSDVLHYRKKVGNLIYKEIYSLE